MSWIQQLCRTYENNIGAIGDAADKVPLLPLFHTLQNAQVQIVIDGKGNFCRASVVPKADAQTIVPATEDSATRTGKKPVAHPLQDKLQYVAGDFIFYGGRVTSGFLANPAEPHKEYIKNLTAWCSSPYSHKRICAILSYVKKSCVIADLVRSGVLHLDENGHLLAAPDKKRAQAEIFRVVPKGQSEAFVRFSVEVPGEAQADISSDPAVWNSWSQFYMASLAEKGLCYVTGEFTCLAGKHPKGIRNSADGAKIISSNDDKGFTFLGRFLKSEEACGVGFEITQKAHSALRWLIAKQGWQNGDQAIVAWAVSGVEVPDPFIDTHSLFSKGEQITPVPQGIYTAQEVGVALSNLIAGYSARMGSTEDVVVMGLDSASPGRLAISFYRELTGSEFLDRIRAWHQQCVWKQKFEGGKIFVGAPAPKDIAEAAYGRRSDDSIKKLCKATVERLLPCIIDGIRIPPDIVESCVRKATNRQGFKRAKGEKIDECAEWEKALGIACALYNHQNKERNYDMTLELERRSRDYLYGRLLALAEHLESRALWLADESRETNAARLMQRFADRPYSTWRTIELSLSPYKARLRAKRGKFLHAVETEMDEVLSKFHTDDYTSDQRLTGEFLLGYHCQRAKLRPAPELNDEVDEDSGSEQN